MSSQRADDTRRDQASIDEEKKAFSRGRGHRSRNGMTTGKL
jgi:hypothetical protein